MLEILQVIIILSAIPLGLILKKISKKEPKQYKKALFYAEKTVLLILILSLLSLNFNYYMIMGFVIGYLLIFNIQFYLGLSLFLSFLTTKNFNFLISSLIFIFNLIYARNIHKHKILTYSVYFLIPFLLFFLKDNLTTNISLFLSFTAGGLFKYFVKFK